MLKYFYYMQIAKEVIFKLQNTKKLRPLKRLLKILNNIFLSVIFIIFFENTSKESQVFPSSNSSLSSTLKTNFQPGENKTEYPFFFTLSRQKHIIRWLRYPRIKDETLSDHCYDVGIFSFTLALIDKKIFGGLVDPYKAAVLGMLHDAPEAITGDIPTHVKHSSSEMENIVYKIEDEAIGTLVHQLPDELGEEFAVVLKNQDPKEKAIVKVADLISALCYCNDEKAMGNNLFDCSISETKEKLRKFARESNLEKTTDYFLEHFMPSFGYEN
jgi:5'-deoxynucleotidase